MAETRTAPAGEVQRKGKTDDATKRLEGLNAMSGVVFLLIFVLGVRVCHFTFSLSFRFLFLFKKFNAKYEKQDRHRDCIHVNKREKNHENNHGLKDCPQQCGFMVAGQDTDNFGNGKNHGKNKYGQPKDKIIWFHDRKATTGMPNVWMGWRALVRPCRMRRSMLPILRKIRIAEKQQLSEINLQQIR